MERRSQDEAIADLINDILALDLDWDFLNRKTYSLKDLQAFEDLCGELANRLQDSKLHAAVWFLGQVRFTVRDGLCEGRVFQPLDLTLSQRMRLKELMVSYPVAEDAFKLIEAAARRGDVLYMLLSREDQDRLFDLLMEAEKEVLRLAGINQRSVAIITQRLTQYRESVVRNIVNHKSYIGINRLPRIINSMASLSKISVRLSDRRRADMPVRLRSIRNLARAKDKVIGLATLWGDALPLLVTRDWGIASVFSAVAGATAAALLPRRGGED